MGKKIGMSCTLNLQHYIFLSIDFTLARLHPKVLVGSDLRSLGVQLHSPDTEAVVVVHIRIQMKIFFFKKLIYFHSSSNRSSFSIKEGGYQISHRTVQTNRLQPFHTYRYSAF